VPGKGGGGQNSTQILNPQPNATFHPFNKAGHLETAVTKHPTLTTAKGQPMCLSWHMLQNACNSNCTQVADHQTHTAAEDNLILAWAKIALAPSA